MKAFFLLARFWAIFLLFTACKKQVADSAGDLAGTWSKGTNTGDTLFFLQLNGKNILRYNPSLNSDNPMYTDVEYKFTGNQLFIKFDPNGSDDYLPVSSFTWKQPEKEFDIQGIQLYLILSSPLVHFTFHKL